MFLEHLQRIELNSLNYTKIVKYRLRTRTAVAQLRNVFENINCVNPNNVIA